MNCRVCSTPLVHKWTLPVFHRKYKADYYECPHCECLQIPDPFWLSEHYSNNDRSGNPGEEPRSRALSNYIKSGRVLDYGGGLGLLARYLREKGVEAYTFDPYLKPKWTLLPKDTPDGFLDCVTMIHVIEHLTNPMEVGREIKRVLRPGGKLIVATELYDKTYSSDWTFMATWWGAHVTLWGDKTFSEWSRLCGFKRGPTESVNVPPYGVMPLYTFKA